MPNSPQSVNKTNMYIPAYSDSKDTELIYSVMKDYSFATLISTVDSIPYASHLPILLNEETKTLYGHLARANPHYKLLAQGNPCLVIFQGPHAYISPNLYVNKLNVPTWNYVSIHAYCTPKMIEEENKIESILQQTVHYYENQNEKPWLYDLPKDFKSELARAICGFELTINEIQAKFKLSQNRDPVDYEGIIADFKTRKDENCRALYEYMLATNPASSSKS